MNFPSEEDELAMGTAPVAAAADEDDAEPRATTVVFPDVILGLTLKFLEDEAQIIFRSADNFSPASDLVSGMVLSSIDGEPVGAIKSRRAYRAIVVRMCNAPRPLTLGFVEGA